MKKLVCVALFFVVLSEAVCFAKGTVSVAAFEYPPIYQQGADKGLSGDLVMEAFKAAGLDAEFTFYPVARMVEKVSSGQADCGLGGEVLFEASGIKPNVTVAGRINYVSQGFLYNGKKFPQGFSFDTVGDLAHYRIGVLGQSGIHKFLAKTPGLLLEPNTSHEGTAKQLQVGRVDVWAVVDLTGLMYIQKLFPAEGNTYLYSKAFNIGDVSVVFSKKRDPNGDLAAKFKEGLATIKKNGTYMKIMAEYYGGKEKINKEALVDDMK